MTHDKDEKVYCLRCGIAEVAQGICRGCEQDAIKASYGQSQWDRLPCDECGSYDTPAGSFEDELTAQIVTICDKCYPYDDGNDTTDEDKPTYYHFDQPWIEGLPRYGKTRGEHGSVIVGFHTHDDSGECCIADPDFGHMAFGEWPFQEPHHEAGTQLDSCYECQQCKVIC